MNMNLALIGYGRMGHEIEAAAIKRGHTIKLTIDVDNKGDLNSKNLSGIDAAIEFTSPESAYENVRICLESRVPVVSGTTGWQEKYQNAVELCKKARTAFIQSSNFSIGVNILFKLNAELARYMENYRNYNVSIEEIHHTRKLDAPSGTALSLVKGITSNHSGFTGWAFPGAVSGAEIPVAAIREGMVPGTHTVKWDSEIDTITLRHEAKNRKGFALGAVVAAEFIAGKEGIFTMNDVMGF